MKDHDGLVRRSAAAQGPALKPRSDVNTSVLSEESNAIFMVYLMGI